MTIFPWARRVALSALIIALLAVRPALALDIATAEGLVRGVVSDAGTALTGGPYSVQEKRDKLGRLVEKYADVPYESGLLLGRYWRKASPAQQQAFADLLVPYVVATYGEMIEGAKVKPEVVFDGAEPRNADVVVHTRLVTPGEQPVVVDWLITVAPGGKVVVADLVADNISMITTLNSDFTAVVRAGGGNLDVLLDAMRKKIAANEAPR